MGSAIGEHERASGGGLAGPGRVLIGLAVACLAAAGGLLWWVKGSAVFSEVVLAGVAWCF